MARETSDQHRVSRRLRVERSSRGGDPEVIREVGPKKNRRAEKVRGYGFAGRSRRLLATRRHLHFWRK